MTIEVYDFIILYGTQTGQSKAVAESISERAERQYGLKTKVCCLSLFDKEFFLNQEKYAVVVISSTGDGDNPESTVKFFRAINRKTLPEDHLKNLHFALLGLGDTNYNNFCACPKRLEKRLLSLGAKTFYDSGFCDDAVGTELVAEPWIEGLLKQIRQILFGETMSKELEIDVKTIETVDLMKNLRIETNSLNDVSKEIFDCSLSSEIDQCRCVWPKPSLTFSHQLNIIEELKVPILAQQFLSVATSEEPFVNFPHDDSNCKIQNGAEFPSQLGEICTATIVSREIITKTAAKKEKYSVWIEISGDEPISCQPGDAFYFICPNYSNEVEWLLKRLNLDIVADNKCVLKVLETTTKKNAAVPAYIPSTCSLRNIFTHCVDFRRPISRSLLRILVEHCHEANEKRRLLELASNQGMSEFNDYVRLNYLSLLDILHAFRSCLPPVERLLEHLPRLQPRPLSIASAILNGQKMFRFVYSLVDVPIGHGRFYHRRGLCTGHLAGVDLNSKVSVFLKKPSQFRLPPDHDAPLILIGPGTGVAPFIGFLETLQLKSAPTGVKRWLFFGCRDKEADYIFKDELESFEKSGVLSNLTVCFSQNSSSTDENIRYVQDNVRKFGSDLAGLLLKDDRTRIFVCGDAKHMAVDVNQAFVEIMVNYGEKTKENAEAFFKLLQDQHRYIQDVWT